MPLQEGIYGNPPKAKNRLAELGLEEAMLTESAKRGFLAWASCTANHPPVVRGVWGWGETVCALRENLLPLGWDRSNVNNLPYVLDPTGAIAISVATGDEDTGRPEGSPMTTSSKGRMTASAVAVNKLQWFLPGMEPPAPALPSPNSRTTWILLMHRDKGTKEVRCELSRPIGMSDEGRVDGWAERIILTPFPFDDDTAIPEDGGSSGPQSPEIVVEIKRRA